MNLFAQAVLIGYVPVVLLIFSSLPPRRAAISSLICAWLFLPPFGIPLPGLPDLTKTSATTFGIILAVALFDPRRLLGFRPRWYDLPIIVWCLGNFPTALSNGLTPYDGLSLAVADLLLWGLPYLIGRLYLGEPDGQKELVLGIIVGGLVYTPFCLWEVRFSGILQTKIYGYQLHFDLPRFGLGYRPSVFMVSGLEVGMWMAAATLSTFWLWCTGTVRQMWGLPIMVLLLVLAVTTVLVKAVGALILMLVGAGLLLLVRWTKSSLPFLILLAVPPMYVVLRTTGAWSGDEVVELSNRYIDPGRAQSFETRLQNENLLVAKALQRPWLGWGGWGRNRVTDERGRDITLTDGLWIITFGVQGLVGLTALNAVFLLPPLLMLKRCPARIWGNPEAAPAAVVAILLNLYMIDNLFNAMPNPVYVMAAGGLMGFTFTGIDRRRRVADATLAQGLLWSESGWVSEAESAYHQAIALYTPLAARSLKGLKGLADAHDALAVLFRNTGRREEAEQAWQTTRKLREALVVHCPGEPGIRLSLTTVIENLGRLLKDERRFPEAEEAWHRAIEMRRALASEFPEESEYRAQLAESLNDLAWLMATGPDSLRPDPSRAVRLAEEAVTLMPERDAFWNTLGLAHYRAGNWEAAVSALNTSVALGVGGSSFDHFILAMAWRSLGDREKARESYDRAEQWLRSHGHDHPQLLRFREEATEVLGRVDRSEALLSEDCQDRAASRLDSE